MTNSITPTEAIGEVREAIGALPACIAGSASSAETYNLPFNKYSDVDVFCFSEFAIAVGAERLMKAGFTIDDRHSRVYTRWLKYGLNSWHTQSLKLNSPDGLECNLVYKTFDKQPLTTLSSVLESFDFGLLATGYDLERGVRMDLRSYLFPGLDPDGPLPLMPSRRDSWTGGFISQYQGLRELGRYAKYARRGYDMSLVKQDLIEGYMAAATYQATRSEPERVLLSKIYYTAAEKIEGGDYDDLEAAGKLMTSLDSLDEIMDGLT